MGAGTLYPDAWQGGWAGSAADQLTAVIDGNTATYVYTPNANEAITWHVPTPPMGAEALTSLAFNVQNNSDGPIEAQLLNNGVVVQSGGIPGGGGQIAWAPARPLLLSELSLQCRIYNRGAQGGAGGPFARVPEINLPWTSAAVPAPTAETDPATAVTKRSATLNGKINTGGYPSTYFFEYGLTNAYGSQTTTTSGGSPSDLTAVSAALGGLVPGQAYHYRVVVKNTLTGTEARGADEAFTLPRGGQQLLL